MTPFERFLAAAKFEKTDYVPVAGAITDFYMSTITPGLDGLSEPEKQIRMLERAAELFPEVPVIFMANPTPAIYPELIRRLHAAAEGGPLRIEHVKQVSVPDPETDPINLERLKEINFYIENMPPELKKNYGYCDGVIRFENPFDVLCEVVGSSEWFLRIMSEPEFVAAAMELFTEASVAGARWLAEKIGAPRFVMLAEDFPGMINRASFEKFVAPYHRRILETFPDAVKLLHNDSRTAHLLGAMPDCGMDVFHFGYDDDIRDVKEAMGGRVALMGNLSPMKVLARADIEVVREHCEAILRAGAPGGGFIFATGGEVNPGTDPARINLMVELAKNHCL